MKPLICCALCAVALQAAAQEPPYRCADANGTVMLADRPCETIGQGDATGRSDTYIEIARPTVVKEYFVLPPSEAGRGNWVRKPPVSVPPKVDVATLRAARQTLDVRDKVASAR